MISHFIMPDMSIALLHSNNRFFVILTDYWFSYHNRSINRLTGESAQHYLSALGLPLFRLLRVGLGLCARYIVV